ncbi:MAG: hypothetical protein L0H26_05775 [Microlunatus sp.]|nr:hypothetical protein [Microlunatus sp.]
MAKQSTVLDGPHMGYGPVQQQHKRGVPLSTVILGIVCVLLAGTLALSIAGRHQSSTTGPAPATTGTATPSGAAAAPPGAVEAATTFTRAWSLPPAERDDTLAAVTVTGLPNNIPSATTAKLTKLTPTGQPATTRVSDTTVQAEQLLSDGSTVRLQLVFEQAAIYGWLVSSVQLG